MKITVIGLGKLGFPIYKVLSKYYKVKGLDKKKKMDFNDLGDLVFIVVPTPSVNGKFTSKYVEEALDNIKSPKIVSIVSTLYPGETDRLQLKYPHLTLVYNPTFVALGSVTQNFEYPDFVLIGSENKWAIGVVKYVLKKACHNPIFCVITPLEAEISKLSLNCYITNKITYANQIGNLCYRLGISPDRILDTIGTDHRVGKSCLKSGLGYGGPCFPRDNIALSEFMNENNVSPLMFRVIDFLNDCQVNEIIGRIKNLKPKSVGFESLSYKKGTDVTERSQLLMIYEKLKKSGYKVKLGKGQVNLDHGGIKCK